MIGFVAAITASLAVIILVVIASLIGFVQSIMPTKGIIKIDELTYRYNMVTPYVSREMLNELVLTVSDMSFSDRIKSYQNGCNYGFNASEYEMKHIATYNYIATNQYFSGSYPVDHITLYIETDKFNNCYIDIHLFADGRSQQGAGGTQDNQLPTQQQKKQLESENSVGTVTEVTTEASLSKCSEVTTDTQEENTGDKNG